ncbi:hypothetical protein L6164_025579 [Bauhinia variegata]|uniref:Uncharacterized protein n=1 Tax=Bauhinia variegata TaxID=167791 RepID=A0ACB9M2E0_BAUVA|nr:hypothetical protein L6164_025579 [Bauhinia variegata]
MSGPQCCSNPPTLNPNSGAGHVEKFGGLDAYVTGPSDSKLAILLISDIFGFEAPKLSNGCVLVPFLLQRDPFSFEDANRPLPVWLKDHAPDKSVEDAKQVVEALKSKGVSAIGAAGFCWGAKAIVRLAEFELIQAAVLLHPFYITPDDVKDVNVPISILGAEIDEFCPPELIQQFGQVLTAAKPGLDCHVKIFPKVSHGWSVRYEDEDAEAVKAAEEAHQNLLEWFAKHVK